jgi:DNA-binding NarL/FixJ family response regulator
MIDLTSDAIRVLVVDNHPLVRTGIKAMCQEVGGLTVIGQAENGQQAVDLVNDLTPDIVLMDIHMPVMNGINATRKIALGSPKTAVIMLSLFDDEFLVRLSMRSGAKGYLVKSRLTPEILEHSIRAVHAGGMLIDNKVAEEFLAHFRT